MIGCSIQNGHHVFKTFKITWGVVVVLVDCGVVFVSRRSSIWGPLLGKMMIRFQYWQALPTQITDKQFWSLPSCVLIKGKGLSNKPNFFSELFRVFLSSLFLWRQGWSSPVEFDEPGAVNPKTALQATGDGRKVQIKAQGLAVNGTGISHQKGKHCFREIKVGEILLHCKLM